jgi:hypothetical protein
MAIPLKHVPRKAHFPILERREFCSKVTEDKDLHKKNTFPPRTLTLEGMEMDFKGVF